VYLFGEPGTGKTTLAQYWALAIAQGRRIHGRRVRPARVLYLALEGKDIFLRKMSVFEKRFGSTRDLLYATQAMALVPDGPRGSDACELVEIIEREKIGVVIFDTWSKIMAGADDNSHRDVSTAIAVFDRIREETGATVIVIAHPNKKNSDDVSGSFTVRKDCDALIRVSGLRGVRKVDTMKKRFGRAGPEFAFKLNQVTVGIDADDDKVTLVDVDEVGTDNSDEADTSAPLTPKEERWLTCIEGLFSADQQTEMLSPLPGVPTVRVVRREALRRELQRTGILSTRQGQVLPDKDRARVRDILKALETKHRLRSTDKYVWLTLEPHAILTRLSRA
jgi:hypothetical protein